MITNECVYCNEPKEVMDINDEYICLDCRVDLFVTQLKEDGYSNKDIEEALMKKFLD